MDTFSSAFQNPTPGLTLSAYTPTILPAQCPAPHLGEGQKKSQREQQKTTKRKERCLDPQTAVNAMLQQGNAAETRGNNT